MALENKDLDSIVQPTKATIPGHSQTLGLNGLNPTQDNDGHGLESYRKGIFLPLGLIASWLLDVTP